MNSVTFAPDPPKKGGHGQPPGDLAEFAQREKKEAVSRLLSVQASVKASQPKVTLAAPKKDPRRQWETELDLIMPAGVHLTNNANGGVHNNVLNHHLSLNNLQKKVLLFEDVEKGSNSLGRHPKGSRFPLVDTAPPSHSSHNHSQNHVIHFVHSDTLLPTSDSKKKSQKSELKNRQRRGIFCRWICVIIGMTIILLGVGIPIALMQRKSEEGSAGSEYRRTMGPRSDFVRRILSEVPLVDGHNDLAWNLRKFLQNQLLSFNFDSDLRQLEPFAGSTWSQTDLIRMRQGGIGAQLWSAYVPCSAQHLDAVQIALEQIDVLRRLVNKYPNDLKLVSSLKDIERAHRERKIASIIGIEGGHALGNSLGVLRMFYELGARYLVLTHNCHTAWADSASSEGHLPERSGLTEFGKLVILEMNRLGMAVDLAHVSVQTMRDALTVSKAPVIFSHSAAFALCNHSRNVPDEILRLVGSKGGIVMVSFFNVFLCNENNASIHDVIAHINWVRKLAGADHVGLGSGFDGINLVPHGLEDVSKISEIISEISKDESWTELEIKKLIGINFLRVFREVEAVRDEWENIKPLEEWIPRSDLEGFPVTCYNFGS